VHADFGYGTLGPLNTRAIELAMNTGGKFGKGAHRPSFIRPAMLSPMQKIRPFVSVKLDGTA
jgi:hypothetical protein